ATVVCRGTSKYEVQIKFEREDGIVTSYGYSLEVTTPHNLICADSNPDTQTCSFVTAGIDYNANEVDIANLDAENSKKFAAGVIATCGERNVIIREKSEEPLKNYAVCFSDGTWRNAEKDKMEDKYDKLQCATRLCKLCLDLPISDHFVKKGVPTSPTSFQKEKLGECDEYRCGHYPVIGTLTSDGKNNEHYSQRVS
ncbi:hypothetical protein PMAYCL1PPCAC_21813, partial [Pristionchus mayeri]